MTFKAKKIKTSNSWSNADPELEKMKANIIIYSQQNAGTTTMGLSALDLLNPDERIAVMLTDPVANLREIIMKSYLDKTEQIVLTTDENDGITNLFSRDEVILLSDAIMKDKTIKIVVIDAIDSMIELLVDYYTMKRPKDGVGLIHYYARKEFLSMIQKFSSAGLLVIMLNKAKNPFVVGTDAKGKTTFDVDETKLEMTKNKDAIKRWASFILEITKTGIITVMKSKNSIAEGSQFTNQVAKDGTRTGVWLKGFLDQKIKQ